MGESPTFGAEAPYFAGRAAVQSAAGPCLTPYGGGMDRFVVVPGNRLQSNLTLATVRPTAVADS